MLKIQVVGHRGVRGIEVENTRSSLLKAQALGVDAVEFDVRLTKDKKLVVCHNRNLKEIYGRNKRVDEMNFEDLQHLSAKNNETIPSLQDILDIGISVPMIMDSKNSGAADYIFSTMNESKNHHHKWMISTFKWDEAARFKKLDKNIWVSLGTISRPFAVIRMAKVLGANSLTLNLILLNPLNYWLARRAGLRIVVYMNFMPWLLTTPLIVRGLMRLYPELIICTDRPDKIVPLIKQSQ